MWEGEEGQYLSRTRTGLNSDPRAVHVSFTIRTLDTAAATSPDHPLYPATLIPYVHISSVPSFTYVALEFARCNIYIKVVATHVTSNIQQIQ